MRYHFVINGYAGGCLTQVKEQIGFADAYLKGIEQGESLILGPAKSEALKIGGILSGEACLLYNDTYSPEGILKAAVPIINPDDLYVFGSDHSGEELCVRTAARAKGSSAVNVHAMEAGDSVKIRKMVYSNHMEGTFRLNRAPYCISIARGGARAEGIKGDLRIIDEIPCCCGKEFVCSSEFEPEEKTFSLSDAKVVIAAGRGAGSRENIEKLEKAARVLGGEVGVSRPAAMNAWAPMQKLIGVSGAMINPEICIAAGVSGAAAFYAGIEKSKFIVAINKDERAPIMKQADVAVAGDFMDVLDALIKIVE